MKGILGAIALAVCLVATPAVAQTGWGDTPPASGTLEGDELMVESPSTGGFFPLIVIEAPEVGAPGFHVVGRIRYQDVVGQGYLEMWSVFPDGGRYFSRTLDIDGPVGAISGTSDWRDAALPFFLEADQKPIRLEINLVLPGAGKVWLEPLALSAPELGWWSQQTSSKVGGWGGGIVGVIGSVLGILGGRRKARRFVLGAILVGAVLGGFLLVSGVIGTMAGQPGFVTYPLYLGGVIMTAVFGFNYWNLRRVYAQAEMREMAALDA